MCSLAGIIGQPTLFFGFKGMGFEALCYTWEGRCKEARYVAHQSESHV